MSISMTCHMCLVVGRERTVRFMNGIRQCRRSAGETLRQQPLTNQTFEDRDIFRETGRLYTQRLDCLTGPFGRRYVDEMSALCLIAGWAIFSSAPIYRQVTCTHRLSWDGAFRITSLFCCTIMLRKIDIYGSISGATKHYIYLIYNFYYR
jgi:hypothetical protein